MADYKHTHTTASYMLAQTEETLQGRAPFFFDLETTPDPERVHFLDGPEPDMVLPPAGAAEGTAVHLASGKTIDELKGAIEDSGELSLEFVDAIEAAERAGKARGGVFKELKKVREGIAAAAEDRRKTLSVTPEFCRISAMGWSVGNGPVHGCLSFDRAQEKEILLAFWAMIKTYHGPIVGFNHVGFDLPVIYVRSILLGVKPSRDIDLTPWKSDCCDVMKLRFPKEMKKGFGLKRLAAMYGIDVPAGDDDGSKVVEMMESDPGRCLEYVKSDVVILRELHRKFLGFFIKGR